MRQHGCHVTPVRAWPAPLRGHRGAAAVFAAAALAASICLGHAPGASAQPAMPPPSAEDLRPIYASALDIANGRRLAEASCGRCHGLNGISTMEGVPNLAGQRAAYLYRELRAYQSGARGNDNMNGAVQFLSNDALVDVAAYFANLDPPPPESSAAATPPKPGPLEAGKAAAAGCAGCHGETGVSKMPGSPNLTGQDPQYLVAAMRAYKGGQRKNDIMKSVLASVGDTQFSNIALYFALQKPDRAPTPAQGDQAAGQAAAAACAGCHGAKGVSGNPATPSLAGQDAQYLAAALRAYKDGSRGDATMKGVAASLGDAAARDIAAFYAAQQPQAPAVRKPLSTVEWAERSDRCHGVNGNSTDPRVPALAGQRPGYLEKVLHAYQTGARKSPEMAVMSNVLGEADIESLAAHYARQKARAVVYLPVPAR
ncbi:MAG: c-type cytochrome [Nevskiales bacterium]